MTDSAERAPLAASDEEALAKLDGGLKRLLLATDEQVREAAGRSAEQERSQGALLERLANLSSAPGLAEADRAAVERVETLLRGASERDPVLSSLTLAANQPARMRALVHFAGNRDDLSGLGLEVQSQLEDAFTVTGTAAQLAALAAQPATVSLSQPRLLEPAVARAGAQARVHEVHKSRPENPTGYQGEGVIVGVVDSPLDVTHHAFRKPTSPHETRVLYYWVIDAWGKIGSVTVRPPKLPGQTPEEWAASRGKKIFKGLNKGRLYTAEHINKALKLRQPYGAGADQIARPPVGWNRIPVPGQQVEFEHGTHVAGIAVGNGQGPGAAATGPVGAAPKADLIHVAVNDHVWNKSLDDDLLNALRFVFEAAKTLEGDRPVVVNVSIGSDYGPHNGRTTFDLGRDALLNSYEKRSIVWAAGNENDLPIRQQGEVRFRQPSKVTASLKSDWVYVDIWSTGPTLDLELTEPWPGGKSTGRLGAEPTWPPEKLKWFRGKVEVNRDAEKQPGIGLNNIRLYFERAAGTRCWIILHNDSRTASASYWMWASRAATLLGSGAKKHRWSLSEIACGRSVLTVGACRPWASADPSKPELITRYSGAGPTLDGRIKPEIVAVGGDIGARVESARSDGRSGYEKRQGTSMAAPLVAGGVALLLEEATRRGNPLDQDTIKGLLTRQANSSRAKRDEPLPRERYGHGRFRLLPALDKLAPNVDVDVWVQTGKHDYGFEPYAGGSFWAAPGIKVVDPATRKATTKVAWGDPYEVTVTVRNRGQSKAVGVTLRLRFALSGTAPNLWAEARDARRKKAQKTDLEVPPAGKVDVTLAWTPDRQDVPRAPRGASHYCLLAEVHHAKDPLPEAKSGGKESSFKLNVKGTNNRALRNLQVV